MDIDDSSTKIGPLMDTPVSQTQSIYEDKEVSQNKKRAVTFVENKAKDSIPRRFTNQAIVHKNFLDRKTKNDFSEVQPKKGILKDGQRKISTTNIRHREEQNQNNIQGGGGMLLGTILSSTQDSRNDIQEDKKGNYEGNSQQNFPHDQSESQLKIRDDFSRKNSEFAGISSRNRSVFTSKQYIEDGNDLEASLLVSETETEGELDSEISDKIDEHIDRFVDNLPPKKDRSEFKNIFRSKFARMKSITPKKVKTYLSRLEKMMQNNTEVTNNIMDKKVDINFVQIPMTVTATEIASAETSIVNFVRDISWAPLTYHKVDLFRDGDDSNVITQTATQTVICMAAMAVGAVLYHVIKGIVSPPKDSKDIESNWTKLIKAIFIWLGAGLSIPGWNALQYIGYNIGLHMNLNSDNAGFFSSLFPGIPEGTIQGITSIISAYVVDNSWNKFRLKLFLKQLFIFATFGAVPGDNWQVVYEVVTGPIEEHDELPDWAITMILGFALATTVYISNVAYGTAFEHFINKSHLIIELEVVEESLDLKIDNTMNNQNLVSYNGRPGAPSRRQSIVVVKYDSSRSRAHSEAVSRHNNSRSRAHSEL